MSDLTTVVGMASKMAQPLGSAASDNVVKNLNVDRYSDGSITAEKTDPTRTGFAKQPDTDHRLVPNSNPVAQQQIKQLQQHITSTVNVINVLDKAMDGGDKDEIQLAVNKGERVRASLATREDGDIPLFTHTTMDAAMSYNRAAGNPANNNIASPFISLMSVDTDKTEAKEDKTEAKEDKAETKKKYTTIRDTVLWEKAVHRIDTINNVYLNAHVHATDVYSRFYDDYNTKVAGIVNASNLSDYGGDKEKSGKVIFTNKGNNGLKAYDTGGLVLLAKDCADRWSPIKKEDVPAKTVWPPFKIPATEQDTGIKSGSSTNGDSTERDFVENPANSGKYYPTKSGAERWAKELGLPSTCIQDIEGVGSVVVADVEPVRQIFKAWQNNSTGEHYTWAHTYNWDPKQAKYYDTDFGYKKQINEKYHAAVDGIYYTSTEYQDIRTVTTANETRMKSTIESMGTRYSNANNTYNNLVKILSTTIQTTSESAKEFLRI